jgi:hypothetical protein
MARTKSDAQLKLEELRQRHDKLYPAPETKVSKQRAKTSVRFNGWTGPPDKVKRPVKINHLIENQMEN